MVFSRLIRILPRLSNCVIAVIAAFLLVAAFPPFEIWFAALIAPVPLLVAIEQEKSNGRSFFLGWLFGNVFFFATCWWLTFAPITYAGFPFVLAYFLLFCVTSVAAIFPGIFGAIACAVMRRFGGKAYVAMPFIWVFTEFLRYWITGNNWNAIGYSQAFGGVLLPLARFGGVLLVSWTCVAVGAAICFGVIRFYRDRSLTSFFPAILLLLSLAAIAFVERQIRVSHKGDLAGQVIALQPNVPMSGLTHEKWQELRERHVQMSESALMSTDLLQSSRPTTVIFPESPMNFMYDYELETKEFIDDFARRNNVSVLFNSAEPDPTNGKFFNSAVLVSSDGREVAQYDKIFLLPFGEAVPYPVEGLLPGFVGNFSRGREYDILPIGETKAGVMICFESHFGEMSREYVRRGADTIVELTNDGYLGPTPVLRQHLANAVLRAVETSRPILRVTNIGITARIDERGEVHDETESYVEAVRIWTFPKSDGSQTIYVRFGDWFAAICSAVTMLLMLFSIGKKER